MSELNKICANCFDFEKETGTCSIRNTIHSGGIRKPMKRKPTQKGCKVFFYKMRESEK